jgi:hypothetical protein
MEELFIYDRQRLNWDIGKVVSLEIKAELAIPKFMHFVAVKYTGDATNVFFRGRTGTTKVNREYAAIEPAVEVTKYLSLTREVCIAAEYVIALNATPLSQLSWR